MSLEEILKTCDPKTIAVFTRLIPIMQKTKPYGWLPEDWRGLANHLSVSRSYYFAMLGSLRAQGILMRGKKGLYCPYIVAEWVTKCVNKK